MRAFCSAFVVGVALGPWCALDGRAACLWAMLLAPLTLRWPRLCLLAGLLLGVGLVRDAPLGPDLHGRVSVVGVISSAKVGREADLRLARVSHATEGWRPVQGRVRLRFIDTPPAPGTAIVLRGKAGPLGLGVLPGAPDPVRNAARVGVRSLIKVQSWRRLGGDLPASSRVVPPLLRALAGGDRSEVPAETWRVLRRTGTAHLLAISGFHVSLVALLVAGSLRSLLHLPALWRPTGCSLGPAGLLGALAAISFLLAAGAPVSAQRATGLLLMLGLARHQGRSVDTLGLLGLVAVGLLLIDPAAIGSPSFQLSFGALVGLIRITPLLLRWLPPDLPFWLRWPLQSAAVTTAATLGTLPAAAWWFQQLAPIGLISNLFAIPWVAVGVMPFAMVAVYGPELLATPASWIGEHSVHALISLLTPLAFEPLTPAVGPLGALALLAIVIWPRRPGLVAGVLLISLGLRSQPTHLRVSFPDVGQGSAVLVQEPNGRNWLVDGGRPGGALVPWLRRQGVRRLDVVAASHGELDHVGGLPAVLDAFEVGALWIPEDQGMEALLEAAARHQIPVLRRPDPARAELPDANDRSLLVRIGPVLLPGDIERAGEARTQPAPVELMAAPHHGSRSSSSERWLKALAPQIAVIQVGYDSPYGHPHAEVLMRYAAQGVEVLRTDVRGTVRLTREVDGWQMQSWRPGRGWTPAHHYSARGPSICAATACRAAALRVPSTNSTSAPSPTSSETPWE